MIHEIATIDVKPGDEDGFIAGVRAAKAVFATAPGWQSLALHRSVEHASRFHVVIGWDTVEDHTEGFRKSAAFAEWRALVGSYFAGTPTVEHVEAVDVP